MMNLVHEMSVAALSRGDFRPAVENPKAEELLGLVRAGKLMLAIGELYDFSRRQVQSRNLRDLQDLVEALSPSVGVSLEFSIAVLTATLPVKKMLTVREEFSRAVVEALRQHGENPDKVLVGLL